jgi:WhiB family redox-sensing transcriptional regulator
VTKCAHPDWISQDLTWQNDAACLGLFADTGEDLFFPPDNPGGPKVGKGVTGEKQRVEKARVICASCPVVRQCLNYAIYNDCHGFWGGMTESERRKVIREREEMVLRRGLMILNGETLSTTATRITRRRAAKAVTLTSIVVSARSHATLCMTGAVCVTEL